MESISTRTVASLLAPTLGWEKSSELTAQAARRLGLDGEALSRRAALAILDELAREPGIVGVTARFARSRGDALIAHGPPSSRKSPSILRHSPPPSSPQIPPASVRSGPFPDLSSPSRARQHLPLRDLASLLAHAIGKEKSEETVLASARRLGMRTDQFDRQQATSIFEDLAKQDGIVGITARFAKARLYLKFGGQSA